MTDEKNKLSQELIELFDIKKAKIRNEKRLAQEALEAQKDIRLLTLMFRDGVPDIVVKATDKESILWNSKTQKLLYQNEQGSHILEGASPEVMVRLRIHLNELVKRAKEFYTQN